MVILYNKKDELFNKCVKLIEGCDKLIFHGTITYVLDEKIKAGSKTLDV